MLAAIRKRKTPWTRGVLGLFVLMWLNLALQSCAMAMTGEGNHDCPHCPPSHALQHDGHAMAEGMAAPDMPCATGAADCVEFDAVDVDSRGLKIKPTNALTDFPPAIVASPAFPVDVTAGPPAIDSPTLGDPPEPSPPLSILYCVYLD